MVSDLHLLQVSNYPTRTIHTNNSPCIHVEQGMLRMLPLGCCYQKDWSPDLASSWSEDHWGLFQCLVANINICMRSGNDTKRFLTLEIGYVCCSMSDLILDMLHEHENSVSSYSESSCSRIVVTSELFIYFTNSAGVPGNISSKRYVACCVDGHPVKVVSNCFTTTATPASTKQKRGIMDMNPQLLEGHGWFEHSQRWNRKWTPKRHLPTPKVLLLQLLRVAHLWLSGETLPLGLLLHWHSERLTTSDD